MTVTDITASQFKRFLAEKKIMGSRCRKCGLVWLPPRPICPECYARDMEWVEMKDKGNIASFTVISVGPQPMVTAGYHRDNSYCAAIVKLDEGPCISAQVIGVDVNHPESIQLGTRVTAEFVERGKWSWGGELAKIQETHLAFRVL